jgi:hypothetical protein
VDSESAARWTLLLRLRLRTSAAAAACARGTDRTPLAAGGGRFATKDSLAVFSSSVVWSCVWVGDLDCGVIS